MSFYIKTRRKTARVVRTWFRCDSCGGYGTLTTQTIDTADDIIAKLNAHHECGSESDYLVWSS